ncbi:MAG TPA: glycoside hydrolase family 15 protein [Candidatus Methylacidiphilales bacterium]
MSYQPIESYGVIGNMRTAALVGLNGSIDWLCLPHFDSPSLFCGILDDEKGGHFQISVREKEVRQKQFYWPDTNVLVTRYYHEGGVAEVIDFMPVGGDVGSQIIRRVKVTRGKLAFRMGCEPAFDYARAAHTTTLFKGGACFESGEMRVSLVSRVPLRRTSDGVKADFELKAGEQTTFVLRLCEKDSPPQEPCPNDECSERLFRETVEYWRRWLSHCTYTGRWRETVQRSALALKLLTFEPTGAIVAAPTCSLPETIGGSRNWDYRYTWIRDAAFTVYGLVRIGFTEEANAFVRWLEHLPHHSRVGKNGPLQPVYRIDGGMEMPEEVLDHLKGYRGSSPVRIGNSAAKQFQLDIYGENFDAIYLANKYANPVSADFWARIRQGMDWLAQNWKREDEGIWETRGGKKHFTYSKVMCWVAFDRVLRLAQKRSFPADRVHWLTVRDEIYEAIMREGWSKKRKAFVQSFGHDAFDASVLIMPMVFFTSANEPRMLSTIDAIMKQSEDGGLRADGLIHRYDPSQSPDGVAEREGTFNLCTFWLVEALTRAGRTDPNRLQEARLLFERMLGYANHLGLYAEQTGFSGEALGNYPQAFTHLSLISAAFNLDRELSRAGKH